VADADRADAEPQRPPEAAQPLLVHVTGRDRVGVNRRDAAAIREDDVLIGGRRGVAAEDPAGAHRRLEALEELQPVLPELLAGPLRGRDQSLDVLRLFGAEVERKQELVRVPEDARTAELLQQRDALARLRPSLRDVAQRDDQVGLSTLQVGKCSAERDGVAVHVGEEGDAHTGTL
jgi:hypothetical protein